METERPGESEFASRETTSESRLRLSQKKILCAGETSFSGIFRIAEKIDNSCISTSLSRERREGEKEERRVTKEPMRYNQKRDGLPCVLLLFGFVRFETSRLEPVLLCSFDAPYLTRTPLFPHPLTSPTFLGLF